MERVLGYGPHAAAERLRVAEALVELPATRAALVAGEVTYSAVRELTRVAVPQTEVAWLAAVRGRTLREIEPMVAGRHKGDGPDAPPTAEARRHVVRFEVSGETLALLRDARIALADATGEHLDHDGLLAALCRAVLSGRDEDAPVRARHQIALTVCETCERGWQDGGGTPVPVEPEVIDRARCDAQEIGRVDAAVPARATQDVPPSVRRLVWRRDHGRCVVPGCRSARFLELHHIEPRSEGGSHTADNLALICFAHHKAVHEGRLVIRGRASAGLTFTHADGRPYGAPSPAVAMIDDAVAALRGTGFTAAQARDAVASATSHGGRDATLEEVIRAALQRLRPTA
jgi:RuvA, C-terminal domain/HNH endonuclease